MHVKNLNVTTILSILVIFPIIIIVSLGFLSLSSFAKINSGVGRIYDDRLVPLTQLKNINDGYASIMFAINKADEGLLNPEEAIKEIQDGKFQIYSSWNEYSGGNLNDTEKPLVAEIAELFDSADKKIQEAIAILEPLGVDMMYDEDGETVITEYNGGLYEFVDPIAEKIRELIALQLDIAKLERERAQSIYERSTQTYLLIAAFSIFISFLSGVIGSRGISVPLKKLMQFINSVVQEKDFTVSLNLHRKDNIGEVAHSFNHLIEQFREILVDFSMTSQELLACSQSLAQSTRQTREATSAQKAQIFSVNDAAKTMSEQFEEVSTHAENVVVSARSADNEAIEGNKVMRESIVLIGGFRDKTQQANQLISMVADNVDAIQNDLEMIRHIAEQTNLLALNAAIEAARAGEAGRGFAVVADEVRALATRTQSSAREIQSSLEALQLSTKEAVAIIAQISTQITDNVHNFDAAGKKLASISSIISAIYDMNDEVAKATNNQLEFSREIMANIQTVSDAFSKTEMSIVHVDSAGNALNGISQRLSAKVKEFKV